MNPRVRELLDKDIRPPRRVYIYRDKPDMKATKATNCTRANLATLALFGLISFGVLAFFFGDKLSNGAMQLITTVVVLLGADAKSAFSFFFDGTPPKPEQATATTPTTDKEPA